MRGAAGCRAAESDGVGSGVLLDPPRLRRFAGALLFAQAVAAAVLVLGSAGVVTPNGGRLGGDFPAFYAAGLAVVRGETTTLYDPAAQALLQRPWLGVGEGTILFPYPPVVAILYAPLALLPFKLAFVLHALLLFGLAGAAAWGFARSRPALRAHAGLAVLATLAFPPLFRASFGGQNTALMVCLVAGALVARQGWVQGLLVGLSWFKPTYGAVLTVWLLAGGVRTPERLWGLLAGGLLLYGGSIPGFGWAWPVDWLGHAVRFAQIDEHADLARSIAPGAWLGAPLDLVMGLGILVAGVGWLRYRPENAASTLPLLLLLVPPHVGWYDVGLVVLPLLALGLRHPGAALALGALMSAATLPDPPWVGLLTGGVLVLVVVGLGRASSPSIAEKTA